MKNIATIEQHGSNLYVYVKGAYAGMWGDKVVVDECKSYIEVWVYNNDTLTAGITVSDVEVYDLRATKKGTMTVYEVV